jgi:hypothetical protein
MLRASLVSLGIATFLLWMVGIVDGATSWMTWVVGVAALLTFLLVPGAAPDVEPVRAAVAPQLIGLGLIALFVAGLVTHASGWLTWFCLAFGCGYLLFGAFAFTVRCVEPGMESLRAMERQ